MTDAPPAYAGHGTWGYRAYALFALTVVYTFNFVDRALIGVTQEPLKHDPCLSRPRPASCCAARSSPRKR